MSKGMRWQTYWRLCKEQEDLTEVSLALMINKLGLHVDSIGKFVSQKGAKNFYSMIWRSGARLSFPALR